jgi:hypothetical protein
MAIGECREGNSAGHEPHVARSGRSGILLRPKAWRLASAVPSRPGRHRPGYIRYPPTAVARPGKDGIMRRTVNNPGYKFVPKLFTTDPGNRL